MVKGEGIYGEYYELLYRARDVQKDEIIKRQHLLVTFVSLLVSRRVFGIL